MSAESDLAWELADAISHLLANLERFRLYATIGSGDACTAIDIVLQTMARRKSPLPTTLIAKLADWLDAYSHSDEAPRLHELLRAIRAA